MNKPEETMSERFDNKFKNVGFYPGQRAAYKDFVTSEIAREQNCFLSQPANEHDNEVRRVERERLLPIIKEIKEFGGDEVDAYNLIYKLHELL